MRCWLQWRSGLPEYRNCNPVIGHQRFQRLDDVLLRPCVMRQRINVPPPRRLSSTPSLTSSPAPRAVNFSTRRVASPVDVSGQLHARFQVFFINQRPHTSATSSDRRLGKTIIKESSTLDIGLKRGDHAHHTGEDQAVLTVKRNKSDSLPTRPTAAQA